MSNDAVYALHVSDIAGDIGNLRIPNNENSTI